MSTMHNFSNIIPAEERFQQMFKKQPEIFQNAVFEIIKIVNKTIDGTQHGTNANIYMSACSHILVDSKVAQAHWRRVYDVAARAFQFNGYICRVDSNSIFISW